MGTATGRLSGALLTLASLWLGGGAHAAVLEPGDILVVNSGGDQELMRVDPASGDREVISSSSVGSGPALVYPFDADFAADGSILVLDEGLGAIVRVDPLSGDRTVVSDTATGSGPAFSAPEDLVVEADGRMLVADLSVQAVLRVDPLNGDRTVVSGSGVGSGPLMNDPVGLALEADGTILVADQGVGLLRIDPASGNRVLASGSGVGSGPGFSVPWRVAVEPDGSIVVLDRVSGASNDRLIRVDPASGDRTELSSTTVGSGPALDGPDLTIEADGSLLIVDYSNARVLRIDPTSGDRSIVADASTGSGPALAYPLAIGVVPRVPRPGFVYVTNSGAVDEVVRIDPATGDRSVLSSPGFGPGPPFVVPIEAAFGPDGSLYVLDQGGDALFRVDLLSGARTVVSDAVTGSGPGFATPFGLAVERDGSVLVSDGGLAALLRVDPASGDRSVLSDAANGTGTVFSSPRGMAAAANGDLFAVDPVLDVLFRVDPASGDRSVVSGAGVGLGLTFVAPQAVAVEADGSLLVGDSWRRLVFRVDPASGDRTAFSGCFDSTCTGGVAPGPYFGAITSVALEADGSLLVADPTFHRVLRVDPLSGTRSIVSSSSDAIGAGPELPVPRGVAALPPLFAPGDAVVSDPDLPGLFRVDPTTGGRRIIASPALLGPPLVSPRGLAFEADGKLLIADDAVDNVFRLDPVTGAWAELNSVAIENPDAVEVALEASGDILLISQLNESLRRMDPLTGDQTRVSGCWLTGGCPTPLGSGPPFDLPDGLAVEGDGNILVTDLNLDALIRVDPVSGDRSVVSDDATGAGGSFPEYAVDIAVDPEGEVQEGWVLVLDATARRVTRVDPVSGWKVSVSGCLDPPACTSSLGSGPNFSGLSGIAFESDAAALIAEAGASGDLMRLDLSVPNGDRSYVSGQGVGFGPAFGSLADVAVAPLCGNGMREAGEACDDGNADDTDCCTSACLPNPAGTVCDDGLFCTTADACDGAGLCVGGPPPDCDDAEVCTTDVCSSYSDTCVHLANSVSCDDGVWCNGADTCADQTCSLHAGDPCPGPDGDAVCAESCDEAADACTAPDPDGSACDDGAWCSGADTCAAGACTVHGGDPCGGPDGDADCSESCNEAADACTAPDPDGSACDDGAWCSGADTCAAGACTVHSGDPCTGPDGDADCAESCDEGADACTAADPNGSACDDADACTTADSCAGGACAGGPALVCNDADVCTDDGCDPGTGCVFTNNTAPCDDGVACTTGDVCSGGACAGTPSAALCDDGDACTAEACDAVVGCLNDPVPGCATPGPGDLLVSDPGAGRIVRVDPSSGDRATFSGCTNDTCTSVAGAGPVPTAPSLLAFTPDGELYMLDGDDISGFALERVDLASGDRTVVSDAVTGGGPAWSLPIGLVAEASGDLVVVDISPAAVYRVDPATGNRTLVSDNGTGSGPAFAYPAFAAVEASGDLIVVDAGLDAVLRVDPVSGDRTVVSDAGTGSGPAFSGPAGVAIEADGHLMVVDLPGDALFRVDPLTGDRAIVSDAGTGAGPAFSGPEVPVVRSDGSVLVSDDGLDAVVRVDLPSGDRTLLTGAGVGAGPGLTTPFGLAVVPPGSQLAWSGELRIEIAALPPLVFHGAGVSTSPPGAHLQTLELDGGISGTITTSVGTPGPLTPAGLSGVRVGVQLGSGVLGSVSGGAPLGSNTLPVRGFLHLCVLDPNCGYYEELPLTTGDASAGLGVGGIVTRWGASRLSLLGNPWTLGTATVTATTLNGSVVQRTRRGTAHGPASLTSSTAQPSGVVQLVTPARIDVRQNFAPYERSSFPLFGILELHFVPEPGAPLLLGAGIAALLLLGWRRHRS